MEDQCDDLDRLYHRLFCAIDIPMLVVAQFGCESVAAI